LKELFTSGTSQPWIWLALWTGLIFISFGPSLWGMGRKPNGRTMNVIYYWYLLGFFPIASLYIKSLPQKWVRPWMVVCLAISTNTYHLVKDYMGPLQTYNWKKITYVGDEKQGKVFPKTIHFHSVNLGSESLKNVIEKNPQFFPK
jgi:hypothetical protein